MIKIFEIKFQKFNQQIFGNVANHLEIIIFIDFILFIQRTKL